MRAWLVAVHVCFLELCIDRGPCWCGVSGIGRAFSTPPLLASSVQSGVGVAGGEPVSRQEWVVVDQAVLYYYCGLLVGFRWSVKISWRMGFLEEQDGAVVCVCSDLVQSIECTLLALAATPLQRTWLNERCLLSFTAWMSFMWFTRLFVLVHPSRFWSGSRTFKIALERHSERRKKITSRKVALGSLWPDLRKPSLVSRPYPVFFCTRIVGVFGLVIYVSVRWVGENYAWMDKRQATFRAQPKAKQ